MSHQEMKNLILELYSSGIDLYCPHGRPVIVFPLAVVPKRTISFFILQTFMLNYILEQANQPLGSFKNFV